LNILLDSMVKLISWRFCPSGSQIHYLSSSKSDGTDDHCEKQGWKRLPEYNTTQRMWKHLDDLAKNAALEVEELRFEDLGDEDYYASLPYAALFSCFKVVILLFYLFSMDNLMRKYLARKRISFFICDCHII